MGLNDRARFTSGLPCFFGDVARPCRSGATSCGWRSAVLAWAG